MPLLGLLVPWLRGPTLILALTMIPVVLLTAASSIYDFTLPSIDGKATPLSDCKGKVVLLVNVASRCGYTPQYSALESLYEKYKDQGFVILGFPANKFRRSGTRHQPGNQDFLHAQIRRNGPYVCEGVGKG